MTTARLQIVHRMIVIRRIRRRVHWRQYRHGPEHDSRVAMAWAQRWVVRTRSTITSDPVMTLPGPGTYGPLADFTMNMDSPFVIEFRCIVAGQDFGLAPRLPVADGIHTIILDIQP